LFSVVVLLLGLRSFWRATAARQSAV
jgi:hypothetical protein